MTVYELMQWLARQNPAAEVEIEGAYHKSDPDRPGQGWRCFHETPILLLSDDEDAEDHWPVTITIDLYDFAEQVKAA